MAGPGERKEPAPSPLFVRMASSPSIDAAMLPASLARRKCRLTLSGGPVRWAYTATGINVPTSQLRNSVHVLRSQTTLGSHSYVGESNISCQNRSYSSPSFSPTRHIPAALSDHCEGHYISPYSNAEETLAAENFQCLVDIVGQAAAFARAYSAGATRPLYGSHSSHPPSMARDCVVAAARI